MHRTEKQWDSHRKAVKPGTPKNSGHARKATAENAWERGALNSAPRFAFRGARHFIATAKTRSKQRRILGIPSLKRPFIGPAKT